MMKIRRPICTNGEEPLTPEEAKAILISRGYDPDAVGKRMNTVAQQALKIVDLESQNAVLLEALERIHINSNTITQSGNAAKMKGALIAINRTTIEAIRNA